MLTYEIMLFREDIQRIPHYNIQANTTSEGGNIFSFYFLFHFYYFKMLFHFSN